MNFDFGQDHVSQLAWDAEHCVAVLGNDTGARILVDLDREGCPLDDSQVIRAQAQGFYFFGILGFVHGHLAVRIEPGVRMGLVMSALPEFLAWLKTKVAPSTEDAWAADMRRLMAREDPREEN